MSEVLYQNQALLCSVFPGIVDFKKPFAYHDGFEISKKLSQIICRNAWSPILFDGGKRTEKNFKRADWCVLDFDGGCRLESCLNDFQDCAHIIATTKSHHKDCHRFRLCIPFERPITDLQEYRHNMSLLIGQYDADQACKDGARFYWPCKDIVSIAAEGYAQKIESAPIERSYDNNWQVGSRMIPGYIDDMLDKPLPEGQRNTTCYIIAKELIRSGYDSGEVYNFIVDNPVYRSGVSSDLGSEIKSCVRSAVNSVEKEKPSVRS